MDACMDASMNACMDAFMDVMDVMDHLITSMFDDGLFNECRVLNDGSKILNLEWCVMD